MRLTLYAAASGGRPFTLEKAVEAHNLFDMTNSRCFFGAIAFTHRVRDRQPYFALFHAAKYGVSPVQLLFSGLPGIVPEQSMGTHVIEGAGPLFIVRTDNRCVEYKGSNLAFFRAVAVAGNLRPNPDVNLYSNYAQKIAAFSHGKRCLTVSMSVSLS